jgi:cell division protein FtsW (lipid II flippase)
MIILFGLLLPLVAYLILPLRLSHGRLVRLTPWAVMLAAVWATLALLFVLFSSPHFPQGTQIAWVGVETTAPSLTLGGARDGAGFAYPNGGFAPEMKLAAPSGTAATVEITGGGGFVYDQVRDVFLNGVTIASGETKAFGQLSARVSRSWLDPFSQALEIISGDQSLVRIKLPRSAPNRVYSLETLVSKNAGDLRRDAEMLLRVEDWAAGLRVLVPEAGDLRLLARDERSTVGCDLPCRLRIHWSGQRLPLTVFREQAKLAVNFEPPWRLASPTPPASSNQQPRLTITTEPLPGEYAFLLPFGRGAGVVREKVALSPTSPPVFRSPSDRAEDASTGRAGVTSRAVIQAGGVGFILATVDNLPSPWRVAGLMLAALLPLAAGLALVSQRVGIEEGVARWVLGGLALTLWNLLVFRLLLALRYALDPSYLDALTVKGVTITFVGLSLAPGLVLLSARLYHDMRTLPDDLTRRRARNNVRAYLVLLVMVFFIEYALAPRLWPELPERLAPGLSWFSWLTILIAIFLPFALARVLYLMPEKKGELPGRRALRLLFLLPLQLGDGFAGGARRLWGRLSVGSRPFLRTAVSSIGGGRRAEARENLRGLTLALAGYAVLGVIFFLVVPAVMSRVPAQKFFQDLLIPFIFCWLPALFWIASRTYFRPDGVRRPLSLVPLAACALLTICLPVFVVPVVIRDPGGIVATLAFFIPVVCVLFAVRAWRVALAALLSIALALAAAHFIYANFLSSFPYLPGEARVRLLTFKERSKIEEYLPTAEVEDTGGVGLPLQKLRDGYQHAWQNMAAAHEGGWTGLGFGNSPARRSPVRQDTLQFDSAYSFFVAAEYGLLGGGSLLLVFAAPLVLVLAGARRRFDIGHAAAAVIAGALLLEAFAHAGMNLGLLPLTGRNLPVTTVNSFTDLLRWTLLFAFAAQAVLWRIRSEIDPRGESLSLLPRGESEGGAAQPAEKGAAGRAEWLPGYILAAALLLLVPATFFALIMRANLEIKNDKALEQPFGWEGMLRKIGRMIDDKEIILHGGAGVANPWLELRRQGTGAEFIEQEIARFNALPLVEKIEESRSAELPGRLAGAASLDEYNKIMEEVRRISLADRRPRRPSVFLLLPPRRWQDESFAWREGEYRVSTNPAFNSEVNLHPPLSPEAVPRARLRGEPGPAIGPAWVMGRWVVAYNPDPLFPWMEQVAQALAAEWARLGSDEALRRYGVFSFDRQLQGAAARLVSEKGRALFGKLLSDNARATERKPLLPPRVALAVISLPQGEVLAMAGYPHSSADRHWRKGSDGQEWLPPWDWLQQHAPRTLRALYGGDRNFDPMVVGSSTKPLWAASILAVHPGLDRQLQVRGAGGRESEVFGIPLQGDWLVSETGWVNFKTYLARSDNRYHVRLGFLGLADSARGEVVGAGVSPSDRESLNAGGPQPWRKYPQFSTGIGFSPTQPGRFEGLQNTSLARNLKGMFSVGIESGDFPRRVSFWTGDEEDDLLRDPQDVRSKYPFAPSGLLRPISPDPPHLALDTIRDPRAYVSLLLGGGTNLWSNVDFAAAFGTCVTGRPVLAHATAGGGPPRMIDRRETFPRIAAKLRPGLEAVVTDPSGTAHDRLLASKALEFFGALRDVKVYAKTGTLKAQGEDRETSRLVIALIRWADERQGIARGGLVISLVGERALTGTATQWVGEFLSANRVRLSQLLSE